MRGLAQYKNCLQTLVGVTQRFRNAPGLDDTRANTREKNNEKTQRQ